MKDTVTQIGRPKTVLLSKDVAYVEPMKTKHLYAYLVFGKMIKNLSNLS